MIEGSCEAAQAKPYIPKKPSKRFCLRGHDTWVVGRESRQCRQCKKDYQKRAVREGRYLNPTNRFCPHGHDKHEVGVSRRGLCLECKRISERKYYRKKAASNPNSYLFSQNLGTLKSVREDLGVTAQRMAQLTGYSAQYIYDLEGGRYRATRECQERILWAVVRLREEQAARRERLAKAGLR